MSWQNRQDAVCGVLHDFLVYYVLFRVCGKNKARTVVRGTGCHHRRGRLGWLWVGKLETIDIGNVRFVYQGSPFNKHALKGYAVGI